MGSDGKGSVRVAGNYISASRLAEQGPRGEAARRIVEEAGARREARTARLATARAARSAQFSDGNTVFTGPGRDQPVPNDAQVMPDRVARAMARDLERMGRGSARNKAALGFRVGAFPLSSEGMVASGVMATFPKTIPTTARSRLLARATRGTVYRWFKLPSNSYKDRYLYVLRLKPVPTG